eukprot:GHVP01063776.1.p1 GENE.GHVP01063776.1~~GHVP01063776.1.p1  ORF type:complete len:175 (-),score=21.32 GHVP01063776.1:75-599(-)
MESRQRSQIGTYPISKIGEEYSLIHLNNKQIKDIIYKNGIFYLNNKKINLIRLCGLIINNSYNNIDGSTTLIINDWIDTFTFKLWIYSVIKDNKMPSKGNYINTIGKLCIKKDGKSWYYKVKDIYTIDNINTFLNHHMKVLNDRKDEVEDKCEDELRGGKEVRDGVRGKKEEMG